MPMVGTESESVTRLATPAGQVLVLYDMLDIYPGRKARFVKNFMQGTGTVKGAIEAYVKAVKDKSFPGPEHSF